MTEIPVEELRSAELALLPDGYTSTGIYKQPVAAAFLTTTGLTGDVCGDQKHHGGTEKALHHYAAEHYRPWREQLPSPAATHCHPGAFGENLVTQGLTETNVCVGDIYRLGQARLEVSQPRQPCWRLNLRFEQWDMALRVQNSLCTGWYYRVLDSGEIHAGDALHRLARPYPQWSLHRVLTLLYQTPQDTAGLEAMAALEPLSPRLRALAEKRLLTGQVEDWDKRLYGPGSG